MYPDRFTSIFWTTPLVEAIRWDCAATLQERFSKSSAFLKRLRFGVDALAGPAVVAGPRIDQAPSRRPRSPPLVFRSNDEVRIGRRDVVARAVITEVVLVHPEQLRKLAPILTSQCEAAAHWFHHSLSSGPALAAHILWIVGRAQLNELRVTKMIGLLFIQLNLRNQFRAEPAALRHFLPSAFFHAPAKFVPSACGHDVPASGHLDVRELAAGSTSRCKARALDGFDVEIPVGTYAEALQSVVPHQSIDSGAIDF